MMERPIEVALVGCGGIARMAYLPALALTPEVHCRWLVDVQKDVANGLARRWHIPLAMDDYRSVLDDVEAVILAVPNHLHVSMALEVMGRGKAVLCEKPLGRTADEVRTMVDASHRAGVPLVAGMTFRQYPGLQEIRRACPWDALGEIREVRASYGLPLDWPMSSLHLFDRERVGGGVLLDLGIHVIDALFWVLPLEQASVITYVDDSDSGLEAEAKAHLTLGLSGGRGEVPCRLEVSHVRQLGNRIAVVGERASLSIPLSSTDAPELLEENHMRSALEHPVAPRSFVRCFAEQLTAFARAVRGLEAVCADGKSQVPVLELVEACYQARRPLKFSWQAYEPWTER